MEKLYSNFRDRVSVERVLARAFRDFLQVAGNQYSIGYPQQMTLIDGSLTVINFALLLAYFRLSPT